MKSFEELMVDIKNPGKLMSDNGFKDFEGQEEIKAESLERTEKDLNGVEISDYEVGQRVQSFLNGYKTAEVTHRNLINKLSFQLNRKFIKGCQVKELIQFYNQKIGGFLDDFVF